MLTFFLALSLLFCAVQAISAARLLPAALWLAGVSICFSLLLFTLGATTIAMIELSVGVGLVTVLLIYAISLVEDDAAAQAIVPRALAWALAIAPALILAWLVVSRLGLRVAAIDLPFGEMLWRQRGLDVLGQAALMFIGALGVLGLLSDQVLAPKQPQPVTEERTLPPPPLELQPVDTGVPVAHAEPQEVSV
jgi:uncharacterized MnhB-related membrane protein